MVDRLVNSEANARRIGNVEACFGSSGQYNKQHIIPLETVRMKSLDDDGSFRNGWQIISATKSFAVYAATATEKSEWMAHINKCITDLLAKSGKKAATEHSPVWVPDSDAPVCMNCHKTKFTTLNRRHHCRKCGKVVCGGCSARKFQLPQMSSKPMRVCDNCHDLLSSGIDVNDDNYNPGRDSLIDQDSSGEDDDDDEDEDESDSPISSNNTTPTGDDQLEPTFYPGNQPSQLSS
ncbi:pleckstrin homology domain-containing family F member 2-like isoform X2 [Glandiceps talaboti]